MSASIHCPKCGYDIPVMRTITDRELEIATLVVRGLSSVEIGNVLYISPKTVKNHLSGIYRKLKLRNKLELTRHLLKENIISIDDVANFGKVDVS
jgi:DNA-binding NarL/FixJ family response regulator